MTERAEHERAADLVEVRVIGRRRPTLEREKAERECLEQRVLLLKAEQPTELFTASSLACALILEACDGPTRIVRVLELTSHELLSDGEVSRSLSFLPRFFAYWHECVDMKKPPGVSRGLVMVQIGRLLLLEKFQPFLFFAFKLLNALLRSREIFRHRAT